MRDAVVSTATWSGCIDGGHGGGGIECAHDGRIHEYYDSLCALEMQGDMFVLERKKMKEKRVEGVAETSELY